jgi:hypothetical protein
MTGFWRRSLENTIVVVGIVAFWPIILGYEKLWYQCLLAIVALALAILALVRFRRVTREFDDPENPDTKGPVR